MPATITRKQALKIGIPLTVQADYNTENPLTDFIYKHSFEGAMPEEEIEKYTNAGQTGNGNEFSTWQRNGSIDFKASIGSNCSTWWLGFIASRAMGKCVSALVSGSTKTYTHTITLADIDDPAVGKQLPPFSLLFERGAGNQFLFRGNVFQSLSLSGKTKEQWKIASEYVGSGYFRKLESGELITMPTAAVQTSFPLFADTEMIFGVDLSALLKEFSFKLTNTLAVNGGYHPGSGHLTDDNASPQVRGNLYVTNRAIEMGFKVALDPTLSIEADNLSNTERSISISSTGDFIETVNTTNYYYGIEIVGPKSAIKTKKTGEDEGLDIYDVTMTLHHDPVSNSPVKIVITDTTPAFLVPAV
jgi:hypothetical protein